MPSLLTKLPSLTKRSVGDAQTFEESLASIGRTTMAAKAPALFQKEIGFQVLDSDDDNTRAVGVFGFRIGKRILYAPLFYRDGVIKGTEQLRDPKRNMVVPLTDNWVNKLLHDQGDEKNKLISRSQMRRTAQPSLWQLKYPPSKYASENKADKVTGAEWDLIRKDLARAIGKYPTFPEGPDLLKTAAEDPHVFGILSRTMMRYPWFGKAVLDFHGKEKFASVLAEMEERLITQAEIPPPDNRLSIIPQPVKQAKEKHLVVIRIRTFLSHKPLHKDLDYSSDDMKEFRAGHNVYKDNRPDKETSSVVTWLGGDTSGGENVQNPTWPGIYKVLGADWREYECAIFTAPVGWGGPGGGSMGCSSAFGGGRAPAPAGQCLVVHLRDKSYVHTSLNNVWVTGEAEPARLSEWVKKLPKVPKRFSEGDRPMVGVNVISPHNVEATVPFNVADADSGRAYPTCGSSMTGGTASWNVPIDLVPKAPESQPDRPHSWDKFVRVWDTPGYIRRQGGTIYLPSDSHLLEISNDELCIARGSDPTKFLFREKRALDAKALTLKVSRAGDRLRYGVEDPRTGTKTYLPDASETEAHLVESHHLKVADARKFVEGAFNGVVEAAVKYPESSLIKEARPPYLSNTYPNSPDVSPEYTNNPAGYADDVVPTETSSSLRVAIPDLLQQPGTTEMYRPYPLTYGINGHVPGIGNGPDGGRKGGSRDPDSASGYNTDEPDDESGPNSTDLKAVSRAAASGRKELFDTAALAALIRHTRLRRLLDDITPRTSKSVSDYGDLLAHMAWNNEEWADTFGESEIGPLEDQIRDCFDNSGELLLKLQEKAVADPRNFGLMPDAYKGDGSDAKT